MHSRGKLILHLFFFGLMSIASSGQDQKIADSLIALYQSGTYSIQPLELLEKIAQEETDPEVQLTYANQLIFEASKDSILPKLYSGYLQKGNALHQSGQFNEALAAYFESIHLAKKDSNEQGVGKAFISVANIYSEMGNAANAATYYTKGIALLRENNDQIALASALLNAGDEAFNTGDYSLALTYFEESSQLFEKEDYLIGTAYNLGNIGMVYAEKRNDDLAAVHINKAIDLLETLKDYYGISVYLTYMSEIYARRGDFDKAISYAERSLALAYTHGLKNQISAANLQLATLYEDSKNYAKSYTHFKDHIAYRDSVRNIEVVEQMADQRTNFEVSQKQVEIDLSEQKRKTQRIIVVATIIALLLIGILALGLFRRNRFIKRTKQIIEEEKDRSDRLLLNILPAETAEELKQTGKVKAKKYDATTVLFTDFKGFTNYSKNLSPEALVETVNFYFSAFDEIIERHALEKIKTIGDAYMCAGGLHTHQQGHAHKMVSAATEIVAFVDATKKDSAASALTFDIRIGIHSGPIVAGVVGTKKFAYDIWGDTVNVASRMESMSQPGRINISEATYELVKDRWDCEYRGEIEVKNRGSLQMYFIKGEAINAAVHPIKTTVSIKEEF